jgi:hypothetical protein
LYQPDRKNEIPETPRIELLMAGNSFALLTREQTTFEETEQEPEGNELPIGVHQTHANLDNRPKDDNCRDPTTRTEFLEYQVRRDLPSDV